MAAVELSDRLVDFGVRVIRLVDSLPKSLAGRRIGDQLVRSAISVGANFEEAQAAESPGDFVHKLQIALKEARESKYWLRLLYAAEILPRPRLEPLLDEATQLVNMLSKGVARSKGKSR